MRKYIFIIVIIQLAVATYIGVRIYEKKTQVLGNVSMYPISRESVDFVASDKLSYFYQPKPNSSETHNTYLPIEKVENTINSDGLHSSKEYAIDKPDNTVRIIALGDSFTYGVYVETGDNWTALLESALSENSICDGKQYEVLNLGVGGYDIQYSVERFKRKGLKYDPDIVIWLLKEDDFKMINELLFDKEQEIRKQLEDSGEFMKLVSEGDYYPSWKIATEEFNKEYGTDNILQMQRSYLNEFDRYFQQALVVLAFPYLPQNQKMFINNYLETRTSDSYYHELPDLYKKDELVIPHDGHPTAEGHQAIAEDVYRYLNQNNIISCD